jgi:hypothetical protein
MKGRRKVRTNKWQIMEQVIKDGRAVLANRTETSGRFLHIAAHSTIEEPVGVLAGSLRALVRSPSDFYNGSEFKDP